MNRLPFTSVIDLYVIQRIFDERGSILSSQAKALYINCLMHHFGKLEASENNSIHFSIGYEIAKHNKLKRRYDELQASGLIDYSEYQITFLPHWNRFIDTSRYNKELVLSKWGAEHFIQDLKKNSIIQLVAMRLRIEESNVLAMVDDFILEKKATETKYEDLSGIVQHFMYWSSKPINHESHKKEKTSVKSQSKEL